MLPRCALGIDSQGLMAINPESLRPTNRPYPETSVPGRTTIRVRKFRWHEELHLAFSELGLWKGITRCVASGAPHFLLRDL